MIQVRETTPKGVVEGVVAPGWEGVADAFLANFAQRGEAGASVCATVGGETVADLWGGEAAPGRAWTRDTVCVVFSCTKAATAACAHLLAARGELDLDAPVTGLWPDYATHGKDRTTTRMMLDHTSGVPVLREPMKADCLTDWDYMTGHLAAAEPFWEPGTRTAYHPLTFGFTVGEMVRRASGRSLGQYFAQEIAGPLGLDFHIGLPEAEEPRVAPILVWRPAPDEPSTPFLDAARTRGTIQNLFAFNHGDWALKGVNTRPGRAAEIGAAGGVTNARGLAGLFAGLMGQGKATLWPQAPDEFSRCTSATHADGTLMAPTRFGAGFMLRMDNRRTGGDSLVIGDRAFGHVGAGGSVGFADPERGLAFGYAMTKMGAGLLLNERGQSLVDAAYAAATR